MSQQSTNVTGWGGRLVGTRRIQGFSKAIYLRLKPIRKRYNSSNENQK